MPEFSDDLLDQPELPTPPAFPAEPAAGHSAAEETQPSAWGRQILRDFWRPSRTQLLMGVILLVCGLLVTMQIRTQAEGQAYSTLRRADLVQMMDDLDAESRRLEAEIADLEESKRQLQSGVDQQRVAEQAALKRLEALQVLGGTVPATGPGIRIVIVDPLGKVTPQIVLNAIEEMRDAGAEVMEFNDRIRVVAATWVGSGTTGLIVDDQELTRPITLDVIGEPHALEEAARFRGGLVSEVQDSRVGGSVTIVRLDKVTISSVRSPKAPQFARPA